MARTKLSKGLRDFLEEFPPLFCTVEGGKLVATNQHDYERLMSWKAKTVVKVWIGNEGSNPLFRRWFGTIGWYLKNTELPWGDTDAAHTALKTVIGMHKSKPGVDGKIEKVLLSLNDIKNDSELENYVRQMEDILYRMTGVDRETMRREGGNFDQPDTYQPDSPDEIIPPSASGEAIGAASSTQDSGAGAPTESSDAATEDNVPEDAASAQPQVGAPVDGAGGYDPIGVEARKWFVSAVLQLWAGTDRGEQALVSSIAKDLKSTVPAIVLRPERDKLNAIVDLCKKVCFQEKKADDAAVEIGVIADMLKPDLDRARATVQKKGK